MRPMTLPIDVVLREVRTDDLPIFFEHQGDPDSIVMAAVEGRDRETHRSHWHRILADETAFTRTIVGHEQVVGNVVSWEADGQRMVGYWIGKEHWGQGIATKALRLFLSEVSQRPLFAIVAKHNLGSIRVLEKCGFTDPVLRTSSDGVEEFVMQLREQGPVDNEKGTR